MQLLQLEKGKLFDIKLWGRKVSLIVVALGSCPYRWKITNNILASHTGFFFLCGTAYDIPALHGASSRSSQCIVGSWSTLLPKFSSVKPTPRSLRHGLQVKHKVHINPKTTLLQMNRAYVHVFEPSIRPPLS